MGPPCGANRQYESHPGTIANKKKRGKPIAKNKKGGKYNSRNSTFKIDLKKGHDSEDVDRRDSMTRPTFRSFCHAREKLYNKPIFSLPNGKTQKGVISKHNHVHPKFYLNISKFESISVRQKRTEKCSAKVCARRINKLSKRSYMVPV